MEFSGRLAAFPMGDLLQWAKNELRTGSLVVRRSEREKRIYFHRGDVVGCVSDDPAEFYGQYLLVNGYLDDKSLFKALTLCTQRNIRLGTALRELNLLSAEVIQSTLRSQIADVICGLFLWPRGLFYFQAEMPTEEEILPEPIDPMALVLEGSRWVDEMARIRRLFPHDEVVLQRGERWPGQDLVPLDRRVAEAVDGRKAVGEVYKKVRGSYFRFLESVHQLCVASVLDIEEVLEPIESGTFEMSVYDLLLEQATEDQVLVARRHMAVPLDLLERWVPVWVAEPSMEEQQRMPARVRDFYARFDGRTPLGEAFSGDPRQRGKELDLFLLQLQKGSLAILPSTIDQLESEAEKQALPPLQRWWNRVFR